jgi:hypothetical protein
MEDRRKVRDAFGFSLLDLPRRSAQALPGGIRDKRPSGILSGTVVPTVFFGQFQLSFPAQPGGYLASSVMFAKNQWHPLPRNEASKLGRSIHNFASPAMFVKRQSICL